MSQHTVEAIEMADLEIKTITKITADHIKGMFSGVLEGPSYFNSWILKVRKIGTKEVVPMTYINCVGDVKVMSMKYTATSYTAHVYTKGNYIKFWLDEEYGGKTTYTLTLSKIKKGLALMARESRHWDDFVNRNGDAITDSVAIQYCLFGDVIFG